VIVRRGPMNREAMLGVVKSMHEYIERSSRVLDEADSTFAPKEGMYTAAQQLAHTAQTIEWFIKGVFAHEGFDLDFERLDREVRSVTSLDFAREWLKRAVACAEASITAHSDNEWADSIPAGPIMGGEPRYAVLGALADHTAHHRGALTVYSRLLGKVPPMPYME
jgi:uncharacterized damage-inducible protein DinB